MFTLAGDEDIYPGEDELHLIDDDEEFSWENDSLLDVVDEGTLKEDEDEDPLEV